MSENAVQRLKIYNDFLPFSKEELDKDSTVVYSQIKTHLKSCFHQRNLSDYIWQKDVQISNLDMGGAIRWLSYLLKYTNLYSFKFSLQDHLDFIRMAYVIVITPQMDQDGINEGCKCLMTLLRREYLVSRKDLVLPWKPLYNVYDYLFQSGHATRLMIKPQQGDELQARIATVILLCRPYFPDNATQQIFNKWRPMICPFDVSITTAFRFFNLFLPTSTKGNELRAEDTYLLWFDDLMSLWRSFHNQPPWEVDLFCLISALAWNTIGQFECDWSPHIDFIFAKIMNSFNVPVFFAGASAKLRRGLATPNLDLSSTTTRWIVSTLGEKSYNTQSKLKTMLNAFESYFYPSNANKASKSLHAFISNLCSRFASRVHAERHDRKYTCKTPLQFRLTDSDITQFVEDLIPIAKHIVYSPFETAKRNVINVLANLKPDLVLPWIVESFHAASESLTEPHKFTSIVGVLQGCDRSLVEHYPMLAVEVMIALVPGIDINDIVKCTNNFILLSNFLDSVWLINFSQPKSWASEPANAPTEPEKELLEQTSLFEEFVLSMTDKMLKLVEMCSRRSFPGSGSCEGESGGAGASSSGVGTSAIVSDEELNIEDMVTECYHKMLARSSPTLLEMCFGRLKNFVTGRILEPCVAGSILAGMVRGLACVEPVKAFKFFVPHFVSRINVAIDERVDAVKGDAQLHFSLLMLSEVISVGGVHFFSSGSAPLIPYIDQLCSVLDKTLSSENRDDYDLAQSLLCNILFNLTHIRPITPSPLKTSQNGGRLKKGEDGGSETDEIIWNRETLTWAPNQSSSNPDHHFKALSDSLEWYLPNDCVIETLQNLINRYLVTPIQRLSEIVIFSPPDMSIIHKLRIVEEGVEEQKIDSSVLSMTDNELFESPKHETISPNITSKNTLPSSKKRPAESPTRVGVTQTSTVGNAPKRLRRSVTPSNLNSGGIQGGNLIPRVVDQREVILRLLRQVNKFFQGASEMFEPLFVEQNTVEEKRREVFAPLTILSDSIDGLRKRLTIGKKNVRQVVFEIASSTQAYLLKWIPDDVECLSQIVSIYEAIIFRFGRDEEELQDHMTDFTQVKQFRQDCIVRSKSHLRSILMERIQIQHEMHWLTKNCPGLYNITVSPLIADKLVELSISHYSEVRCLAQEVLGKLITNCPSAFEIQNQILPIILDVLNGGMGMGDEQNRPHEVKSAPPTSKDESDSDFVLINESDPNNSKVVTLSNPSESSDQYYMRDHEGWQSKVKGCLYILDLDSHCFCNTWASVERLMPSLIRLQSLIDPKSERQSIVDLLKDIGIRINRSYTQFDLPPLPLVSPLTNSTFEQITALFSILSTSSSIDLNRVNVEFCTLCEQWSNEGVVRYKHIYVDGNHSTSSEFPAEFSIVDSSLVRLESKLCEMISTTVEEKGSRSCSLVEREETSLSQTPNEGKDSPLKNTVPSSSLHWRQQQLILAGLLYTVTPFRVPSFEALNVWLSNALVNDDLSARSMAFQALECVLNAVKIKRTSKVSDSSTNNDSIAASFPSVFDCIGERSDNEFMQYDPTLDSSPSDEEKLRTYWKTTPYIKKPYFNGFSAFLPDSKLVSAYPNHENFSKEKLFNEIATLFDRYFIDATSDFIDKFIKLNVLEEYSESGGIFKSNSGNTQGASCRSAASGGSGGGDSNMSLDRAMFFARIVHNFGTKYVTLIAERCKNLLVTTGSHDLASSVDVNNTFESKSGNNRREVLMRHKLAADMLCGLIRGITYFEYDECRKMQIEHICPLIDTVYREVTQDSLMNFDFAISSAISKLDLNRFRWVLRSLMGDESRWKMYDDDMSHDIKSKNTTAFNKEVHLTIVFRVLRNTSWRARYLYNQVMEKVGGLIHSPYTKIQVYTSHLLRRLTSINVPLTVFYSSQLKGKNQIMTKEVSICPNFPSLSKFIQEQIMDSHAILLNVSNEALPSYKVKIDDDKTNIVNSEKNENSQNCSQILHTQEMASGDVQGLDQDNGMIVEDVSNMEEEEMLDQSADEMNEDEKDPMKPLKSATESMNEKSDFCLKTISKLLIFDIKNSWTSLHSCCVDLLFPYICQFEPKFYVGSDRTASNESKNSPNQNCLFALAHLSVCGSSHPTTYIPSMLDMMEKVRRSGSYKARLALLEFTKVFLFTHFIHFLSSPLLKSRVKSFILTCMTNESDSEVSELSSTILSGLFHSKFIDTEEQLKMIDTFKKRIRIPRGKKPKRNDTTTDDDIKQRRAYFYSGILGLCAVISAYPYEIPPFIPDLLVDLEPHLHSFSSSSSSGVCSASSVKWIKKTMQNFKRTHQDNWAEHKTKFTPDQLVVMTDLLISPSYYA